MIKLIFSLFINNFTIFLVLISYFLIFHCETYRDIDLNFDLHQQIVYFDTRGQNGRFAYCECENAIIFWIVFKIQAKPIGNLSWKKNAYLVRRTGGQCKIVCFFSINNKRQAHWKIKLQLYNHKVSLKIPPDTHFPRIIDRKLSLVASRFKIAFLDDR